MVIIKGVCFFFGDFRKVGILIERETQERKEWDM